MDKKRIIKEICEYILIILVVILIRTFVFTPIRVEQKSMYPTLNQGDIMILNKIGYKLNGLDRFDIVVLKLDKEHLIKRVIGLPNEVIEYKNNKLYVNNKYIKEDFINTTTTDFSINDLNYTVIPKGKYLVLGDNRLSSVDSRIFGLVDEKDIIGKTNFILFPFKEFGKVN